MTTEELSALTLTERVRSLREDVVNVKSQAKKISVQVAYRKKRALAEAAGKGLSNELLKAAEMCAVIDRSPAVIDGRELIVGWNYGDGRHDSGFSGDRETDAARMRENGFSEEEIGWYSDHADEPSPWKRGVYPAFEGKTAACIEEYAAMNTTMQWNFSRNQTENHSVIGYEAVLRKGFEGLEQDVAAAEAKNGPRDLYTAMRRICRTAAGLGEKYAAEAERMGMTDAAAVCRRVPRYPARSFREAVQSLWFAHVLNTWEDGINANSLGHLDWILQPWYEADLTAGRVTRQEAFELICCLWLKLYRDYDVQQSCVGGRDAAGASRVNELSWMMLEATERLDFVRCLSVRFDRNTDPAFLRKALEVVGRVQKGIPFFFNDDAMIPALVGAGISQEDAADYTQIGCVETVIPGRSNPHAVNSRVNVLKALEYALADGRSMLRPELRPGLETGDPAAFGCFEDLTDAFRKQLAHLCRTAAQIAADVLEPTNSEAASPYKSLLTEGCLESGRDFNDRGAKYDYYQVDVMGVPNAADSLEAIRRLVFEEKRWTLPELIDALREDWPDESMRQAFLRGAPKYGNDCARVDSLAAEIIDLACDCLEAESRRTGLSFHAQPFTYLWMIEHGARCAASADGRHAGEILAYSLSPMQGRDEKGLSALMNSLCSLPTTRSPGTVSAIVEVDPKLFCERNLPLLTDLLLGAAEKGLSNVQFNTVTLDTLLDARAHPEKHRNLAVRVSGFSQKFCLLEPALQDHIIARTKHAQL